MKKIGFIFLFLFIPVSLSAQVFGTGSTLKPGRVSFGVNPAAYLNNNDFYLFLHGGVGMAKNTDLGFKVGLLGNVTYVGGDIEWCIARRGPDISIAIGAHHFNDFGLDGTLNFTFRLARRLNFYTGCDLDVIFVNGDTSMPFWLFVGTDISIARRIALLVEAEIAVSNAAYNIISGGFNFYF
jgi:hypothetical protein